MIIKDRIKDMIARIDSFSPGNELQRSLHSAIKIAMTNWRAPQALPRPNTLRELIAFEVNEFMRKPKAVQVIARKTAIEKATITTGFLTAVTAMPPSGRLDSGKIVNFNSRYPVYVGTRYRYVYNPASGVYTVSTYRRGTADPRYGKHGGGITLSEQLGKVFIDQSPDIAKVSSIVLEDSRAEMLSVVDQPICRLEGDLAAYIKNGKYIEFMCEGTDKTVVQVRSIDLTAHLALNTNEVLTIGKYLPYENYVLVIVFKHTRYPVERQYDDVQLGERYEARLAQASVRGELLIINRTSDLVTRVQTDAHIAPNQLYFSGFVDMLVDCVTGAPVFAKLSESPYTTNLVYSTAKLFIAGSDRKGTDQTDVTKTTVASFNSWLSSEAYSNGMPDAVHVIKDGSNSWMLHFPLLTIGKGKIDSNQLFSMDDILYDESSQLLNSRSGEICRGGYTNCMLYQDEYDSKNKFPIYVARKYDAWKQFPYPSNDYTVTPTLVANTNTYFFDTGKYCRSAAPGEIVGLFGVDYFRLEADKSLTHLVTVPGGFGRARTFCKDDTAGIKGVTGMQTSTELTLLQVNNMISNASVDTARLNSVYNTFCGGPGNCALATATANQNGWYFNYLWGTGLHIYNQRFAILVDPTTSKLKVLVTGSYEPQVTSLDSRQYYGHDPRTLKPDIAESGIFVIDCETGIRTSASLNWVSFGYTTNTPGTAPVPQAVRQPPQYTLQATRADIHMESSSSYYCILSAMTRQFDIYTYGVNMYIGGWLWWWKDRQMYKLLNGAISGWAAETKADFSGDESYGVLTPKLQVY